jgi:hypothetical protein
MFDVHLFFASLRLREIFLYLYFCGYYNFFGSSYFCRIYIQIIYQYLVRTVKEIIGELAAMIIKIAIPI